MRVFRYFWITAAVILVDQTSKLLVQHYMYLHEEISVLGEWFKIHYLLNPGMAFGFQWQNEFGKLALTLFRIVIMWGIAYHLYRATVRALPVGYLVSIALILGGAVGNVIDSLLYGVLLGNQPLGAPTPWFHGQVVDMLFFPLFDFYWPTWVPWVGGDYFLFFSPVFNIADSCIFIGVVLILLFQRKWSKKRDEEQISNTLEEENQIPI